MSETPCDSYISKIVIAAMTIGTHHRPCGFCDIPSQSLPAWQATLNMYLCLLFIIAGFFNGQA